jgi:plastocyanin
MKNNGTNRSPVLAGTLRALGLVGVLGMAGAIVLIGPLAGSGCNEDDTSGSSNGGGGTGGTIGGTGGHGGVTGAGGGGGSAVDAGGDGSVVSPTATQVLIQGMAFMPNTLTVAPGATVTVHNVDTTPHTMTSESTAGSLVPGGVAGVSFNTDIIPAGGSASFTIPANAPHGTMVPFYCIVHGAAMQGMLTVQ